jgi:hypothetical protein
LRFYSIDQQTPAIPATTVSQSGSTFKMTIAALNGNFEGRVGADGNTITGTWTQGALLPLTLVRATAETAWTIPEPPPPPKMMEENAKPEFEVATIKPARGAVFSDGEQKRYVEHDGDVGFGTAQIRIRSSSTPDRRRPVMARIGEVRRFG